MNATDRYLKFVQWNEADKLYVGYCPGLFPWGGVCHAKSEEQTHRELTELVRKEVEELTRAGRPLPEPAPMKLTSDLENWLLEAAGKPTTPLARDDFNSIRERVRARRDTESE